MKRLVILVAAAGLAACIIQPATAQVAYVTYYQPAVVAPAPAIVAPALPVVRTAYYATPTVVPSYQPVARVNTRYRPWLGRSVTRVRYGYAPTYTTYYPPAPVVYGY